MKRILFFYMAMAFSLPAAFAAVALGADISYRSVGGNNYEITLRLYRDCSAINLGNQAVVSFKCMTNSSLNFTETLIRVSAPVIVSNNCLAMPGRCVSTSYNTFGADENIYVGIVALPACGDWRISYTWGCRAITNTLTSNSDMLYVEASFNSQLFSGNSSPVFTNPPFFNLCIGQAFQYNPGLVDPDGDSLSYEFIDPRNAVNSNLTWNYPYCSSQPFLSNPPITLDTSTGTIKACPSIPLATVSVIRVKEWRTINGIPVLVGTVMRDCSHFIDSCANQLPVLSGFDTISPSASQVFDIEWCVQQPFSRVISGHDPDVFNSAVTGNPEKFSISWNNGIQAATFTALHNGTDSAKALINWAPTFTDVRPEPYCFTATIKDEACPYFGIQTYLYRIFLKGKKFVSISGAVDTICLNHTLTLNAASGFTQYIWSDASTSQSIVFDAVQYGVGLHNISVTALDSAGCPSTASVSVYVSPCTGIEEKEGMQLSVFPNPAKGSFTVSVSAMDAAISLELFNTLGQRMFHEILSANGSLQRDVDISALPKGSYLIKASNEKIVLTRVLIAL